MLDAIQHPEITKPEAAVFLFLSIWIPGQAWNDYQKPNVLPSY